MRPVWRGVLLPGMLVLSFCKYKGPSQPDAPCATSVRLGLLHCWRTGVGAAARSLSFPRPSFNPVVIDKYSSAWQFGGLNSPLWYRAYASDDPRDTREMAILGPFTVLGGGER